MKTKNNETKTLNNAGFTGATEMNAQGWINAAAKTEKRKGELYSLFYPASPQQLADRNLTKILKNLK